MSDTKFAGLHPMTVRGRVVDARNGVPISDDEDRDRYRPCGALDPHPEHLRGDDERLFCSVPGKAHLGPHRAFGFGMRLREWPNSDADRGF